MQQHDQSEVLRFLTRPATHATDGNGANEVIAPLVIQTHISVIVLVGQQAYKLKRAARLPYLDFSTPARRLAACQQELDLNRRTAPSIYQTVRRITRRADGELEWDGPGELVDAVVQMRRFDENGLLEKMAARQQLTQPLMTRLARSIAQFHASAARSADTRGAKRLAAVLDLNEQSQDASARILDSNRPIKLNQALRQTLAQHVALLDARAGAGKVRRCHGDLHLRNICMVDGNPTLFDCLEFNESMATIDVLYDLAFLLMDLWRHNERALANVVMNRYMDENDETDGLPLLPFFMALRAAIRAQVLATQADIADADTAAQCIAQANDFLDLAFDLLKPCSPALVAVGGLSGSGKSTVATALADSVGPAPGARVLSSDRIRKHLAGVPPEAVLPAQTYTQDASDRVYHEQAKQTERVLTLGHAVIADAVFSRAHERATIQQCAAQASVPFTGVWLETSAEQLIRRVQARKDDPSDATADVVRKQLQRDLGEIDWIKVPSDGSLQTVMTRVARVVKLGTS